jgi:hypothetical protein
MVASPVYPRHPPHNHIRVLEDCRAVQWCTPLKLLGVLEHPDLRLHSSIQIIKIKKYKKKPIINEEKIKI